MIFDILFVALIGYVTYKTYESGAYKVIFGYLILMIAFTIATKYALTTAKFLTQISIINAETVSTMILIGFGINLALGLGLIKLIDRLYIKTFKSKAHKSKRITGYIVSFVESLVMVTFVVYILSQIVIVQKISSNYLKNSYTYKYTKKFYRVFLNDDFIKVITNSSTGLNTKEVLFKSLGNVVDSL